MKIFLVSQSVNNNYDTYDAIVVYAENEESAKLVRELDSTKWANGCWVKNVKDLKVEYLGEAPPEIFEEREILASFNAG